MANIPTHPEQDAAGGGDLPTYEDLAQQNGPNSRSVLGDHSCNFVLMSHFTLPVSVDGEAG